MPTQTEAVYSPEPIGHTAEGNPIYLYQERILAEARYVVRLPNGKAVFSDRDGRIGRVSESDQRLTAALLSGLGGIVLAGPIGGLAGAAAGATAAYLWSRRSSGSHGSIR